MVYIQRAHPEIYARTKAFLSPKDYLTARLSGRLAATFDSVAECWVTDNRDPMNIDYVPSLIALSGLDREKFPDLCAASDVLGPVLPEHRERFGLSGNVVVVGGAPDLHSAAIGAGTTATSSLTCTSAPRRGSPATFRKRKRTS